MISWIFFREPGTVFFMGVLIAGILGVCGFLIFSFDAVRHLRMDTPLSKAQKIPRRDILFLLGILAFYVGILVVLVMRETLWQFTVLTGCHLFVWYFGFLLPNTLYKSIGAPPVRLFSSRGN